MDVAPVRGEPVQIAINSRNAVPTCASFEAATECILALDPVEISIQSNARNDALYLMREKRVLSKAHSSKKKHC